MAPKPDVEKPQDDPFALVGSNWIAESENAYTTAENSATAVSKTVQSQARIAADAEAKMTDEEGRTAESVSGGYSHASATLHEQSVTYDTIAAWMLDAGSKVRGAKKHIANLVSAGTQEIRDALNSETQGTSVSPSSTDLTATYRADISQVKTKLDTDLAAIGHSLSGTTGSLRTPSYTSVSLTPTSEHPNPAAQVAAYNTGPAPEVTPRVLPEMPRATAPETPSTPRAPNGPAAPHINPTLASLISPQGASTAAPSTSTGSGTQSTSGANTPTGQQRHQPTEQHPAHKSPAAPSIPAIQLPDLPAAASTVATVVTSAAGGTQLPTTAPASTAPQVPASTGITPGASGAAPASPVSPGLGPIGGLPTPPAVMQPASPTAQATPAPGVQTPAQQAPTPAPRGPLVTAEWLQRTYGTALGLDLPKAETPAIPALFITSLPEDEAHLHRALASLRRAFEETNWSQPMVVATLKRGLETCCVYATTDAISIHPSGVLLPTGVIPLDEMPSIPSTPELSGSIMVADKLTALIPRGWTVEHLLSTVPGGENSQSIEQYQQLVESGELLPRTVSRGDDTVTEGEAVQAFAMAVLGQNAGGMSDLGTDSAQLKAARWVGTQPAGYLDVLGRWHLSDAADAMGRGLWSEAVYAIGKFQSIRGAEKQVA